MNDIDAPPFFMSPIELVFMIIGVAAILYVGYVMAADYWAGAGAEAVNGICRELCTDGIDGNELVTGELEIKCDCEGVRISESTCMWSG